MLDVNERGRKILEAVIRDYIRTAEPVGSRTLSRSSGLSLSPATIRNVMADLEDIGLLDQPYTSAGRVPTDKGLRYYVDTILEVKNISDREREAIEQQFSGITPEIDQLIKRSSKVLSWVSKNVGVVMAPKFSGAELRQIEFIRLSERLVLAILVGQTGVIQNRIIEVEEDIPQEDLERFNRYLNDVLGGLTISEIKAKLVEEMRHEKNRFDQMLSRALVMAQKVLEDDANDGDVILEGRINMLDHPEFADVENMKAIFRTFEDKSILVKLLDNTMNASGVQIFIGSENDLTEMEGCTLIVSRYSRGTKPLGTLGVIGPTRLNYSRIIPVVDYTAKLVGNILESMM